MSFHLSGEKFNCNVKVFVLIAFGGNSNVPNVILLLFHLQDHMTKQFDKTTIRRPRIDWKFVTKEPCDNVATGERLMSECNPSLTFRSSYSNSTYKIPNIHEFTRAEKRGNVRQKLSKQQPMIVVLTGFEV